MIYLCGTMVVPLAICSINFRDGLNRSDLMSDSNPRILRNRRTLARPSNSDEDEHNPYGYPRASYTTVRHPPTQQSSNPAVQLNSHAKLLVRFCNSVNRKCREAQAVQPPAEAISPQKLPSTPAEVPERKQTVKNVEQPKNRKYPSVDQNKKYQNAQIGSTNTSAKTAQVKNDHRKRSDIYHYKSTANEVPKPKYDAFLAKMKGQASQSATNMINLNLERNIYPGFPAGTPIANQLGNINLSQLSNLAINNISQLNGLALSHIAMMGMNNMNMGMNMGMGIGLGLGMPNMHGNPSMHNNAGNTTNGTANGMSMNVHNNMDLNQMQQNLNPSMMMPMNMQQPLQQQQRPEPIDLPFTQKIFKRASYHIAIAYHIHIKQCRERGIIGAEMDPAYHARRLKESKRNEG